MSIDKDKDGEGNNRFLLSVEEDISLQVLEE